MNFEQKSQGINFVGVDYHKIKFLILTDSPNQ